MPLYIGILKFTDKGRRQVPHLSQLIARGRRIVEEQGGRVVAAYATMGEFDAVTIVRLLTT